MTGGTGRASVYSPTDITIVDDVIYATIVWSSSNYDYMVVDGKKILNEAKAGEKSTFTFEIPGFDTDIDVIGDTTAMSVPHEIEYTLRFERR